MKSELTKHRKLFIKNNFRRGQKKELMNMWNGESLKRDLRKKNVSIKTYKATGSAFPVKPRFNIGIKST